MIYLITGVPGSGKTLYAVSTLVQKLAAEKVKDKHGVEFSRRVVVDGIPNLLLPHEVMTELTEDDKGNFTCAGNGLLTWPDWCQAGDILVVDEVQRYWRPRGMGTKPPEMIKALETHRHKGVDFIIVTQNPMLIDQNVRRLVGRHLHVRRLFGMARAVIYDWDGCSVDVNRTKTATTTMWNYPKSAYALYKSSDLHTKQRQKIPPWLIVPVLAIVGGLAVAPQAFGTLKGAMTGKGVSSVSAPVSQGSAKPSESVAVAPVQPASYATNAVATVPQTPASAPELPLEPKFAGCVSTPKKCGCFDVKGVAVAVDQDVCLAHIVGMSSGVKSESAIVPDSPDQARFAGDVDVLAFMFRNASRPQRYP